VTAGGTPPPVDIDAFRAVMREAGIEEIVEPTLRLWVEEAPDKFERLEAAVAAADPRAAANAAHALRSSSAVICADALVASLTALELAGQAGRREEVEMIFRELRSRYQEALAYMKAIA
jgi:HPt (histidine-containing phosphotransfer) domain-containing protein